MKTTLAFTGDIGFDKYMSEKWLDEKLLSDRVKSFLTSADHVIINVEGPLSKPNTEEAKAGTASLKHSMNPDAVPFFKSLGADIWNICNNHIMDCGPEGLADTLEEAKKADATTLGAGMDLEAASKPVIINEAGGIGLIGVGYQRACRAAGPETPGCFSWSDLELIEKRIKEIKKQCRWCVIVAHAGEEFTPLPSPYTRERYLKYLEMGADVIIAHHPHVPMNYELVGDKMIFYSLGNFIFDTDYQRAQFNTELGVMLKLEFTEAAFKAVPCGLKLDRNTDHIDVAELPRIFTNVPEEEYNKLIALSTKAFIENTKRQWRFLKPAQFANASEEDWVANFYEPLRSGRVPGETLDFQILYPLAQSCSEEWKSSKLEAVKSYILEQM